MFFVNFVTKQYWGVLPPVSATVIFYSSGDLNVLEQDGNPEVSRNVSKSNLKR